MTRKEAFTAIINQRGVHHKLGLTSEHVRQYRYMLKNDKVSEEAMRAVLKHYGATLKQEEVWEISKP